MQKFIIVPILSLAVAFSSAQSFGPGSKKPDDLAAALQGRTAGKKMTCVSQRDLGSNRSYGEEAILFSGKTGTKYVNHPPAGCPVVDGTRTLVIKTIGERLCRGDIVSVVDSMNGIDYGSCALGDFTPYRKKR